MELPDPITENQLLADKDRARGLIVARYEAVYQACLPHIDGTVLEDGGRVDARMVKIGLDAVDRLHKLYRLDAPAPLEDPDPAALEAKDRTAVAESLLALEARIKGDG
jgi:hypothetical protein